MNRSSQTAADALDSMSSINKTSSARAPRHGVHSRRRSSHQLTRRHLIETMEPRCLMTAAPIQIGGVYIEEDGGSDVHGDSFIITFQGGAEGTQLTRLVLDGDLNEPGFGLGDLFFDTAESGLGADHAFPFQIVSLTTVNPNATVRATVQDGSTRLVLEFTNFVAGDRLVFSIDVDEVQHYDPSESLEEMNEGFDPITSGIEFQGTLFQAEFTAPHYEIASGESRFLNRYDDFINATNIPLPRDNDGGQRDRTAGTGLELQQIPKPISLAGTVYVDANEDLVLQSGEQRLASVRLDLYRLENGNYVATGHSTTTDANGRYNFETNLGLQPGTYQVRQSQPAGYYSVGATPGRLNGNAVGTIVAGNPDILTQVELLLGDQHATELNFAENLPASISGSVCYVISGFDCFSDTSEKAPLADVLIELRDASGTVIGTTRTLANGTYRFDNLRAGVYSLTEITPGHLLEGDARVGSVGGTKVNGSLITQIIIGGGVEAVNYDFCELSPSELSGFTYYDQNSSGRRDNGEVPIANVLVQLWDSSGNKVAEMRTDAQGFYKFTNLRPGTYRVTEVQPGDYLPGQAAAGTIGGQTVGTVDASGNVIQSIVLPAGSKGLNYDFGELLPGSISGQVIVDTNGNCIIDAAGDMPLPGVTIELLNSSGSVISTTLTDAEGRYTFDDLTPGIYSVREVQPAGYFQGAQKVGSGGGDASTTDWIRSINVTSGSELIDYDFCEIPPDSIAGTVFVDSDLDCFYDPGESPIAGVVITLLDANGNVVATTTTDANGNYRFEGLRPGQYSIRQTQPSGYLQGGQRAGSGGGDDSVQDLIRAIDIGAGARLVEYNFCEINPGSIAGTIFVDDDEDCVFDAGELPIAGVTVTLLDESGTVIATTVTDANGNYLFEGLAPGRYTVRESQPVGYFQGGQSVGSGGGDISVQDQISAIDLTPGADLVDYDFCELLPGSISGIVFADLDFDCIRDPDEMALSGVRIDLLDANGTIVGSTTTNAQGAYTFGNLRPGVYSVREHQPIGYFQGGQMAPATGGNATVADWISGIAVGSNRNITEANFCEVPPAELAGYVFQDGAVIVNATGTVPDDLRTVRDGLRTADDQPIAGVTVQLRLVTGAQAPSSMALPGIYSGEFIEVQTDENGYYHFAGLRGGSFYHVFQVQPNGFQDGLDTPGTTSGMSLNSLAEIEAFFEAGASAGLRQFSNAQLLDAVIGIALEPGQFSLENNFSEVLVDKVVPVPPLPPPPSEYQRFNVAPPLYLPANPLAWQPLLWSPLPLLIGYGHNAPHTWHLSVINGGYPRGMRNGEPLAEETVANNAERLDVYAWTVRGLQESSWRFISSQPQSPAESHRMVFDLPGATPLAGDFNGDGFDELALFVDGEWFIDINANGRWDEADIWLKLGARGDQPVVGDWDNDGKDDVGVFGRKWAGDDRAIAYETGLPDPENRHRIRAKNVPPPRDHAPDDPRLLKKSRAGQARADVIDHVFQFGGGHDIAVTGDYNGDGISSIGVYRNGRWLLDANGDGKLSEEQDREIQFGEVGDLPLVGDFDGDGIDEIAVVRGNRVIVDSNDNGRIDATDQVFLLESTDGTVIVGDFNGDGFDEPALHQSAEQRRLLEARKAG